MPRIYVGTYAKYNAGSIAGQWLDLEDYSDAEEFNAACRELHKDEADPELMFQDYEGFPSEFYGESHLDARLWDWLQLDDDDRELLAVYTEHVNESGDIDEAREAFCGKHRSEEDYAQELFEECHEIPDFLAGYIDWERVARDLRCDGYTFVHDSGETWVFRSC